MKEQFTLVTDPATVASIRQNDFHSPIHAADSPDGAWVYAWSMDQYRECLLQRERSIRSAVASEFDSSELNRTG